MRVATKALPAYAHRFSPKKFTQPQLFACLVLKTFSRTDYRGITVYLEDLPDLVRLLGLKTVPPWSTLHQATKRLLRLPMADRLLTQTVRHLRRRRRTVTLAAFDSTGLHCGHASSYFVRHRARGKTEWQTTTYKHFAKREAAFDGATHGIVGAIPRRGPRVDTDRFVPLRESTLQRGGLKTVLADAGYDMILLALDEALTRLAAAEPQAAELVHLRYFAGQTMSEAVDLLGLSLRSAHRLWAYAKAWLLQELERD